MEGNAVSSLQRSDTSTIPQSSDGERNSPANIESSQRQVKPVEPSDRGMKINEEISMLTEENTRLIQERDNLIADLEECKSELFKRMPPTQISDDSIQKAYGRIRGSIDSFVFDTMKDVAVNDALYNYCQKKQQSQKPTRHRSRNPLRDFIKEADISAWGPYECSNFYILSVIIQWILDEFVFRKRYPIGITENQIQVLEEVEKGMRHASQAQAGQERIEIWRSETLIALTAPPENGTRLDGASRKICKDLSGFLSPCLLEAGPFAKVEGTFRREILDPAIKLHQDLRSSSHQYDTRHITFFDRLSPKQMLEEWDLKDADSWLEPRGEKKVGKALYCLHPSIVRLRTKDLDPIVIVKPVIVVTSPGRERTWDPPGSKNSSLKGMTPPPVAIEFSPTTNQITSSLDQKTSAQIKFADNPSTLTDSDSTTASRSRRRRFSQSASTQSITQMQGYLPGSPRRQLSVPLEFSDGNHDLPRYSRSHIEEEKQLSRRFEEDQNVLPYTRGHSITGTSNTFPPKTAARQPRQPSRRSSKDTSGDKSSSRKSANENLQPPIAPSAPVSSTPLVPTRSFMDKLFSR